MRSNCLKKNAKSRITHRFQFRNRIWFSNLLSQPRSTHFYFFTEWKHFSQNLIIIISTRINHFRDKCYVEILLQSRIHSYEAQKSDKSAQKLFSLALKKNCVQKSLVFGIQWLKLDHNYLKNTYYNSVRCDLSNDTYIDMFWRNKILTKIWP